MCIQNRNISKISNVHSVEILLVGDCRDVFTTVPTADCCAKKKKPIWKYLVIFQLYFEAETYRKKLDMFSSRTL